MPLALLATLASGFVTIVLLAAGRRERQFRHAKAVIVSLLLYNLLVILGLAWEFIRGNLPGAGPGRSGLSFLIVILLALGYLKILWVYSLMVVSGKVFDRPIPARTRTICLVLGGLMTLLGGAALAPSAGSRLAGFIAAAFGWLEYPFFAAVVGIGIFLALGARRLPPGRVRRAAISLSLILLVFFSAGLAGLVLGSGRSPGNIGIGRLANALGLVLFNLAIWIWVRAHAEAFPSETVAEFHATPPLLAKFGITGREIEIIGLVCRGKTNREIADELCISPQTVKDHNYNIFRKTGVKNRTQLARLFMR